MKTCAYCGRENDDIIEHCGGCATPFTASKTPGTFADAVNWTPTSPAELASTSGLAALLICTGIFFATCRAMGDLVGMKQVIHTAGPARYVQVGSIVYPAITLTLFSLGMLSFTFFVCYKRCLKDSHAIFTAIATLGIIATLTLGPIFCPSLFSLLFVVPVVLIGMSTGGSIGYYIGAALQIFAGAWLLGWFKLRKAPKHLENQHPSAVSIPL
jgi:hypothetical protein